MENSSSVTRLFEDVARLATKDFEMLFNKIAALQLRRAKAKTLPAKEAQLLQLLNQGFPADKWLRLNLLDEKSEYGSLTEEEETELLQLAEDYEDVWVQRLKILSELAALRNTTPQILAEQLGIRPNYHA
jgi:hypothetical protein